MTVHTSGNDTWVDETGVGDGTVFTAARMEKIEGAIDAIGGVPISLASGKVLAVAANTQPMFAIPLDIQPGAMVSIAPGGVLVKV